MKELLFIVQESLDGGYEAKAIGYSIYTQCETYGEIKETIRDAVICHFENKEDLPSIIRINFVKEEIIAV